MYETMFPRFWTNLIDLNFYFVSILSARPLNLKEEGTPDIS